VPPHLSQAYQDGDWSAGSFPLAEQLAQSVLSLPLDPHLSLEECGLVIDEVARFARAAQSATAAAMGNNNSRR
jgi:dTDP-4-amino-4,6-dideoxygalactose transaminase